MKQLAGDSLALFVGGAVPIDCRNKVSLLSAAEENS